MKIEVTDAPRPEDETFVIERTRACNHRGSGYATYSFQALGFYQGIGYREFGRLPGVAGKYDRHYLHKQLDGQG